MVPPTAALHSTSVVSRYFLPSFLLNQLFQAFASFQETFTAGWLLAWAKSGTSYPSFAALYCPTVVSVVHIRIFVPGTGTNFMPKLFTNGASFVAGGRLPLPPPVGAVQLEQNRVKKKRAGFIQDSG